MSPIDRYAICVALHCYQGDSRRVSEKVGLRKLRAGTPLSTLQGLVGKQVVIVSHFLFDRSGTLVGFSPYGQPSAKLARDFATLVAEPAPSLRSRRTVGGA